METSPTRRKNAGESNKRTSQRAKRKGIVPTRLEKGFVTVFVLMTVLMLWANLSMLSSSKIEVKSRLDALKYKAVMPDNDSQSLKESAIKSRPSSPYAYLWIVGGIHEDKPSWKGFIWDILISASLLRKVGSTADLWIYIRLSPDSKEETLPAEEVRLLDALGVQIKYLEKPKHESFGQLVYDKFLAIGMTDYKRVMFLDADTIPLMNLDFFFHLSDPDNDKLPTILKPNLILATRTEPCNTGMFMVEPSADIFTQYKETVRKQHEQGRNLPYPHFSRGDGWGYNFKKNNDQWEAIRRTAQIWIWHASHSDQGLMYYIAKFLYKDVSIVLGERLQNWKAVDGQKAPELESETLDLLKKYQPTEVLAYMWQCDKDISKRPLKDYMDWSCRPPYNSFSHFMGKQKPWQNAWDMEWVKDPIISSRFQKGPIKIWFKELNELNTKHSMGLDLERCTKKYVETMKVSALGYQAEKGDQANIIGIV